MRKKNKFLIDYEMSETDKAELIEVLETKERESVAAIKLKKPFLEVEKLPKKIRELTKTVNKAYTLIDDKASPKYTLEQVRGARAAIAGYQDPKTFSEDVSTEASDNLESSTPRQGSIGQKFYTPKTELDDNYSLNVPEIATSTSVTKDARADLPQAFSDYDKDLKKLDRAAIEIANLDTKPNLPTSERIKLVKKEVLEQLNEDTSAKYLSEPDNEREF